MNLDELSKVTLPFGKYKGKCIDEVPLDYLDWLRGQAWLKPPISHLINEYLKNPTIAREFEEEMNGK